MDTVGGSHVVLVHGDSDDRTTVPDSADRSPFSGIAAHGPSGVILHCVVRKPSAAPRLSVVRGLAGKGHNQMRAPRQELREQLPDGGELGVGGFAPPELPKSANAKGEDHSGGPAATLAPMLQPTRTLPQAAALVGLMGCALLAQVPAGSAVVSTTVTGSTLQTGGLFIVDLQNPGVHTPILGLPSSLVGWGIGTTGANCIARDAAREALVAGEVVLGGQFLFVHRLVLQGLAVSSAVSLRVVFASGFPNSVIDVKLLPGGDAIALTTEWAGSYVARLSRASWTAMSVVPMGITFPDMDPTSLAVDPTGTDLYVAFSSPGLGALQGRLHRAPVAGGTSVLVATIPSGIRSLSFDSNGYLLIGTYSGLLRMDPVSGTVWTVLSGYTVEGVEEDVATGNLVFCTQSAPAGSQRAVLSLTPSGTVTLLSTGPPGMAGLNGWGDPSGIVVRPALERFGPSTPGTTSYSWAFPNPGGLPLVGNTFFSITESVTGPAQAGFLAFSTASTAPVTIGGVSVVIDVNRLALLIPFPAGTTSHTLPVPPDPAVRGLSIFLQAVHFDPSGAAATEGLALTVL
jgi:hypothetical protein